MKWRWDCAESQQHEGVGDVIWEQHLSPIGVCAPGPSCLYTEGPGFTDIVFFVWIKGTVGSRETEQTKYLEVNTGSPALAASATLVF